MQNFSNQCLDLARSLLGNNLKHLNPDGTVTPSRWRVTPVPMSQAMPPSPSVNSFEPLEKLSWKGMIFSICQPGVSPSRLLMRNPMKMDSHMLALAYFLFGASKERNAVWERLTDPTPGEQLDQCLLARSDHEDHFQVFNVAKSVARFSFGLTKKDDTGKVIDRFVERIESNGTGGFLQR